MSAVQFVRVRGVVLQCFIAHWRVARVMLCDCSLCIDLSMNLFVMCVCKWLVEVLYTPIRNEYTRNNNVTDSKHF